ncbi:peptide chain release factor N(5)-glutamine methyltransferase [Candidatus Omnitrophota bacterium]
METETKAVFPQKDIFYLLNKYSDIVSRIDAEILLSHIFRCARTGLYTTSHNADRGIEKLYDSFIKRRLSGEPIQYITGTVEFMGLAFAVNRRVFIPRPETEILANEVLLSTQPRAKGGRLRILDLCTGCGNIAISLARLIPDTEIVAMDISGPALEVAQKNSILHGVDKYITFLKGDAFQVLPGSRYQTPKSKDKSLGQGLLFDKKAKFDIIVCNPPYIKSLEIGFLQKEVRLEPEAALDGGPDGLEFYRLIADVSPDYLKERGSLFLEIGFGQAQHVVDIFNSRNLFEIHKVKKDFTEIDRVAWIDLL